MKKFLKIATGILFLGFCSSHGMIIKKTFQKSKTLLNRHYATNTELGNYYLTTPWWFDDTDEKTIKEAAENLTKYGPFLYAQCNDGAEKEHIKNLLKNNSALAQKRLNRSREAIMVGIFAGASSGSGAIASYGLMCKDPSYAPLFVVNSSLFVLNYFWTKKELKGLKTYQSIIDFQTDIENYDEMQLKKFKETQN